MFTEIILVSFCGGLLCLDRVFVQAMISRPVIIAPLIGLLLHNLYAGLVIGAFIELIWIDRIPIGTYIPPNDSITAVVATSTAIIAGQKMGGIFPPELIAFSILLAIPCGILAKQMDILIIKSNDILSDRALADAGKNNIRGIEQKNYLGLMKVFLFDVFYVLAILVIFIPSVIWLYPKFNATVLSTLTFTYYFLPLLGIAVAINMLKLQRAIPVICAIF